MTACDTDVLGLLDALVRIGSVNPGLDPGSTAEAEIAAFVASWGRAAGLRTETVEGTPGRPSVILRGGRNRGGRRPAYPRLTVTTRTVLHRDPMETAEPIVRALLAAAGPGSDIAGMSYRADSAFLSAAGIPTVVYGPEGEGARADVEWVSRTGTRTVATVLTRLVRDICA